MNIIEKFKFELFYKTENKINMKICSPNYLSRLKQVKSVILDKNQTITDNELTISGLMIFQEFYEINENEIPFLRDLLSQLKNDKSIQNTIKSFKEKKIESISFKEIPLENNDAELKMKDSKYVNIPYFIESNDSKNALHTNLTNLENNTETFPPFLNLNFNDEENFTITEKEKDKKVPDDFFASSNKRTPQEGHKMRQLKYLESIKNSVLVPHLIENDKEIALNKRVKSFDSNFNLSSIDKPKSWKEICSENFTEVNELFTTLLLCHFTKTKIDTNTLTFSHESCFRETNYILEFCEKFGYSFKGSFKITESKIPVYEIKKGSENEYYPIICFNDITKNRTRFSLIIGRPFGQNEGMTDNEGSTLYVHGDNGDEMVPILNLSNTNKERLKEKIEKLREKGHITIIYAKREMSAEETKKFMKRRKIIKTSLTIKEEELESLYNQIEEKLELICVVCLKENLRPEVVETISNFNDSQLKIYFVSGDNECLTLASAFHSGIISNDVEVLKLQADNKNSALISIKWILRKLRKKFSPKDNLEPKQSTFNFRGVGDMSPMSPKKVGFDSSAKKSPGLTFVFQDTKDESNEMCILIDGSSFSIIYKNKYLRQHFLFLMLFCKLVCHDFCSYNKKRLAKMVKILENATNNYVLGIGDGYDDVLMLKKCDISIEIKNHKDEIVTFTGDFIVNNFKKVSELVFFRANQIFTKIEEITYYMLYVILSLLFNLFYYSWFSHFTGTSLISPLNMDVMLAFFCVHIIIIYFLFDIRGSKIIYKILPLLSKLDMRIKKVNFKRLYMKTVIPALCNSSIIFFISFFSTAYYNGCNKSLTQINVFLNISYYFTFCLRVTFIFIIIYFY